MLCGVRGKRKIGYGKRGVDGAIYQRVGHLIQSLVEQNSIKQFKRSVSWSRNPTGDVGKGSATGDWGKRSETRGANIYVVCFHVSGKDCGSTLCEEGSFSDVFNIDFQKPDWPPHFHLPTEQVGNVGNCEVDGEVLVGSRGRWRIGCADWGFNGHRGFGGCGYP